MAADQDLNLAVCVNHSQLWRWVGVPMVFVVITLIKIAVTEARYGARVNPIEQFDNGTSLLL